ncbi:hypothetical protein B0H13DRAFT_1853475 [Mycena leptocephala]|nr:hypothetical protein B0H13DRAFT_1853475 [Mycena leptocephala]
MHDGGGEQDEIGRRVRRRAELKQEQHPRFRVFAHVLPDLVAESTSKMTQESSSALARKNPDHPSLKCPPRTNLAETASALLLLEYWVAVRASELGQPWESRCLTQPALFDINRAQIERSIWIRYVDVAHQEAAAGGLTPLVRVPPASTRFLFLAYAANVGDILAKM